MSNTGIKEYDTLVVELKQLIIDSLELEDITPNEIAEDAPLFSEDGIGLDSIDAMELGVALKRRYNVTISEETEDVDKHFATVGSLARFVGATLQK